MAHAEGGGFEGGRGDELTQRTLPLFFEILHLLLAARVSVVAEAAFQTGCGDRRSSRSLRRATTRRSRRSSRSPVAARPDRRGG
jgi:hypothetical protein